MSFAYEVKDIRVRNISTQHGLSHHTVNTIWQDEFGFIWIGTLDGLNRFDGHHFNIFKPDANNPYSITENNIRQICGDGQGYLYIRGLSSLSEYDMRTKRFRPLADNVKEVCFAVGSLWVSDTHTISIYDRLSDSFVSKFSFTDGNMDSVVIAGFCVGASGNIYVRTLHHGLFVVNKNGNIVRHFNIAGVKSVLEDRQGNIWVGTLSAGVHGFMRGGRVLRYQHDSFMKELEAYDNIRSMCEDKNGDVWLSTYGGLAKIDVDSDKLVYYRYESDALNIRSVTPILYDRQGSLWVGSFHNGVSCYNPDAEKYNHYRAKTGNLRGVLNSPIVSSFAQMGDDVVFIGTEGGWVNVLDRKSGLFGRLPEPKSLNDRTVKGLLYNGHEKMLYVSTLYGGIVRVDMSVPGGRIYSDSGQTAGAGNMLSMVECGRDSILVGTNKGVRVFDKRSGQLLPMNTGFTSVFHRQVWDIAIDNDGKLWFTTSSDLHCYDMKNDVTRRYAFGDIVSKSVNNHFNHILKDSKGRLWFGSSGSGFFLYDKATDSFRRFSEKDGLPSGFITEICEDKTTGFIYVATNRGLVSYDPDRDELKNCDLSTNFPTALIRNMFIASNGELFVSDLTGVVSVSCRELENPSRDYDVLISGIVVDNQQLLPNPEDAKSILKQDAIFQKEIRLSPRHSSLSFELTNTDYLNNSDRLLEYKLDGFDSEFFSTSGLHPITYTNLSAGKYTFVARGTVPDSNGEYPTSEIVVFVAKPFVKTIWFILLMVFVAGCVIWCLLRIYATGVNLRSQNTANESKLHFFTNISHEFRTPLTLINGQLEMLLQQDKLKPSVYSRILSIYRNASTMNNLVNEIVDMMKSEAGKLKLKVARYDVVAFLREIYVTFDEYARQRDISLSFETDSESLYLEFDNRQLEKVFFNLLSNAFKYTSSGGGRINIIVHRASDGVLVKVKDNGTGIAPEHIGHIFDMFYQDDKLNASLPGVGSGIGLSLSKAIVQMHGGNISVESTLGSGTCFTVLLKYKPVFSGEVVTVDGFAIDGMRQELEEYKSSHVVADVQQGSEKGVKMLVVEDSMEILNLLVSVFSPMYDVITASSGEEGLSRARKDVPDIIVSDVMMPGMSGIEMCRILKENIETSHIPIVLLTAYALENYVVEGFSMGADDYVTKPFNVKILVARCDNLVRGRRRLQEKYMSQPEAPVTILASDTKDQTLLEKAVSIVMAHIDDPEFKIDVFAHELGLSRTYLFSKIKGLTGQSPNEFITTIRLKEAVVRLTGSKDESISEIAYSLGFSSSSYFINCFKARYGKTPAQYRKEFA